VGRGKATAAESASKTGWKVPAGVLALTTVLVLGAAGSGRNRRPTFGAWPGARTASGWLPTDVPVLRERCSTEPVLYPTGSEKST